MDPQNTPVVILPSAPQNTSIQISEPSKFITFKSLKNLTIAVTIMAIICAITSVVAVFGDLNEQSVLKRADEINTSFLGSSSYYYQTSSYENYFDYLALKKDADNSDNIQSSIGYVQILTSLGFIIAFLMWIYRAYKNLYLSRIGRPVNKSAGWAVGYYFIPFVNFYMPFKNLIEVRKLSGDKMPFTLFVIVAWWILYLVGHTLSVIVTRLAARADDIKSLITYSNLMMTSDILDLISYIIVILLVWVIYKAQEANLKNTENSMI